MAAADIERKVAALTAMAMNYGRPLEKELAKLWLMNLREYTAEQVERGVSAVVCEYAFKTLPPFAVLRAAIDKACGVIPEERRVHMAAEAEWGKLRARIRECGWPHPPREGELHPTTAYVLRLMGGWEAACRWYSDDMHWRQKEFVEHWEHAHGHEDDMALGATAILEGGRRAVRAGELLGDVLAGISSGAGK